MRGGGGGGHNEFLMRGWAIDPIRAEPQEPTHLASLALKKKHA